jgi:hypothetical protein
LVDGRQEVEEGAQAEGEEEEGNVGSSPKVRRRRRRRRISLAAHATRMTILPAHFCVTLEVLATKPFTCIASSPLWNEFRRVSGIADVVSNDSPSSRCRRSWRREVEGIGDREKEREREREEFY